MMENQNRAEAAASHYRPDIDGLRAVAVLPVVFYHYQIAPFTGGFVGVDIFFVISGFLITSLIYAEMQKGNFSIVRFYERRVRRIFPALFAVLIVATVLAVLILFPEDLRKFAMSLAATTLFASNFEFWHEAGYFDTAAAVKPLLHTWSLAVEEQFYLIYPAVLFLLRGAAKRWLLVAVCCILVLSFAESVWGVAYSPSSTFYLLPARMWELMLGAVLAIGQFQVPKSGRVSIIAAFVGIAFIGIAIFGFTAATPFPGPAALLPCVGAALLIYAGSSPNFITGVLSTKPLVFVGLVSYSLYLWHWPLWVFANYALGAEPGLFLKCVLIVLSFLFAWGSLRFVEQPFRGKKHVFTRARLFTIAIASMALAIIAATALYASKGLPQRYPADVQVILRAATLREPLRAHCFNLTPAAVRQGKLCRIGDAHAPLSFIFWGDSHADALMPGVAETARKNGKAGLFAAHAACPPLLGVGRQDALKNHCQLFNDAVLKAASRPDIGEVILAARWARNAIGTTYGDASNVPAFITDDQTKSPSFDENKRVFVRGLDRTLAELQRLHKRVVIIGPVPEVSSNVPTTLARAKRDGRSLEIGPTMSAYHAREEFVLHTLSTLARKYGATVLYPDRVLCGAAHCDVMKGNQPIYVYNTHLNLTGAHLLVPMLEKAFKQ